MIPTNILATKWNGSSMVQRVSQRLHREKNAKPEALLERPARNRSLTPPSPNSLDVRVFAAGASSKNAPSSDARSAY